jgi:hypothetical protein
MTGSVAAVRQNSRLRHVLPVLQRSAILIIAMDLSTSAVRSVRSSVLSCCSRALVLAVMTAALGVSAGCANVQPYERAKLAHPTMTAADGAGHGEAHLRAISEGAIGGSGGTGSGCGCN